MAAPKKSADAFRTISEVASWLETPAHVLRFWESRFPEISPVKGAGGRRYYRPDDMRLLGGIKRLLHEDGHTIKAVQEKLAADGVASVAAFSPDLPMAQSGSDDPPAADPAPAATPPADNAVESEAERPPIGYYFDDSADAAEPAPTVERRSPAEPEPADTLVLEAPLARKQPSLDHVPVDPADPDPACPFAGGLGVAALLRGLEQSAPGQVDLGPLAARLRSLCDRAS